MESRRSRWVLAALVAGSLIACSDSGGEPTAAPSPSTSATSAPSPSPERDPTATPDPGAVPPADAQPCPEQYDLTAPQPWVPAPPATSTAGRLAPDADPVEVVLCRYTGGGALDGPPVRIDQELQAVRIDLQVPPAVGTTRACTPEGEPLPHLARLTYADGDLWVASASTANGCADTGNGAFVSGSSRGRQLAASYEAQSWVPGVGA